MVSRFFQPNAISLIAPSHGRMPAPASRPAPFAVGFAGLGESAKMPTGVLFRLFPLETLHAHCDNLNSLARLFKNNEHRWTRYAMTLCKGRNVWLEVAKSAVFIDVFQFGAGGGTRTHTTF